MKRSPIKRMSQLKRRAAPKRAAPKRKAGSTKYARRERDWLRMAWCKQQPCAALVMRHEVILKLGDLHPREASPMLAAWMADTLLRLKDAGCDGHIEAHHAGAHGTGNKAPDDTVIPLCHKHHAQITGQPGGRGVFDGWPRGSVKAWELAAVAHYQKLYSEWRAAQSADDALF